MPRVHEWPLTVKLSNGVLLPRLGFGTHQLRGEACTRSVEVALRSGYRHIDTASIYKNETEVNFPRDTTHCSGVGFDTDLRKDLKQRSTAHIPYLSVEV